MSYFTFKSYYAMIARGCHYKVLPLHIGKQVILLFLIHCTTKSHIESTKLLDVYECVCVFWNQMWIWKRQWIVKKRKNRRIASGVFHSFVPFFPFLFIILFFTSFFRAHAYMVTRIRVNAHTHVQTNTAKNRFYAINTDFSCRYAYICLNMLRLSINKDQ